MAASIQINDKNRLKILDCLLDGKCVTPNITSIQRKTGLHKATIKASLERFRKEKLFTEFLPRIDVRKLGYRLSLISLLEADQSQQPRFDELIKALENDPNTYNVTPITGFGKYNLMVNQIFKDIDDHINHRENFFRNHPDQTQIIRDTQYFYTTGTAYKDITRTESVIRKIQNENGFQ